MVVLSSHTVFSVLDVWQDKESVHKSATHISPAFSSTCIELWNRMNEMLSCTQVKCSWLMPTAVKDAPVSDIDFRSAKKLRQKLDQTINGFTTSVGIARSGRRRKFQFLCQTRPI